MVEFQILIVTNECTMQYGVLSGDRALKLMVIAQNCLKWSTGLESQKHTGEKIGTSLIYLFFRVLRCGQEVCDAHVQTSASILIGWQVGDRHPMG